VQQESDERKATGSLTGVHFSCIFIGLAARPRDRQIRSVDFEWDEDKRRLTLQQRGVDMVYAALIFEGLVLTRRDDRQDYGEERLISLGMVENECFIVVHTERNGSTRLITAWKGGRDERAQYEAGIARRHPKDEGER
jgi:uncharacterized DUF497 family protein